MIGHADHLGSSSGALDAAEVRLLVEPRASRVVEGTSGERPGRDGARGGCPPAAACCPAATPPPFACYLEDRNVRDVAEFTFSEHLRGLPRAELYGGRGLGPERAGPREMKEPAGTDPDPSREPLDPALRGPRLGDVSPVETTPVQRRLQVVYRLTVPVGGGGRIDLIG